MWRVLLNASSDQRTHREAANIIGFYTEHGGAVYARCRQILGDDAAAEDATQETFLRVARHLQSAGGPDHVLPWLYRIATNYCLNELRNRSYRPLLPGTLPERPDAGANDVFTNRDLVARAIATVPPKVRLCAWLYHVDGLDQEEVATVVGVSRRTVATRLARFQSQSRKFLERSER